MAKTSRRTPRGVGGGSREPALRAARIVAELARRAGESLSRDELLAIPSLRALYAAEQGAALQALRHDLRKLAGGSLRRAGASAAPSSVGAPITYDRLTGTATLAVEVPRLRLSADACEALSALAYACRGGHALPGGDELFAALISALPAEQRSTLASALGGEPADPAALKLELALPALVEEHGVTLRAMQRALRERRTVRFRYLPPGKDGETIHSSDEVGKVRADGSHIYVTVWCDEAQDWLDLRLERIVPGSVELSPRQYAYRRRRGIEVRYWLAPAIARPGVTERLEGQHVEPRPDGSAIVSGRARSRFWAQRLLLGYGEHARALDPPELVADMRQAIERMGELYQGKGGKEGNSPQSG